MSPAEAAAPPGPLPLTLNVPQAAELVGIDKNTLYRLIQRNEFPHLKLGGRIVIPTAKLLRFLNGEKAA